MKDTASTCIRGLVCLMMATLTWGCGGEATGDPGVPDASTGFATAGDIGARADSAGGNTGAGNGPTGCQSDEDCIGQVNAGPCQSVSCGTTGLCSVVPVPDSTPCGEDDPCLSAGACAQGLCIGQPTKCDDGNPCTDGSCKPDRGCVYFDNTASCDDADLCTTGDSCTGGKCVGTLIAGCGGNCGDGTCTDDEDCASCAADCGPCSTSVCGAGEVTNCVGGCSDGALVGNGACDDELNCSATGLDGGDCTSSTPCAGSEVAACSGQCVDAVAFAEMLTNSTCDAALNCGTFGHDGGLCTGGGDCEASDFPCADGDGCISTLSVCDGSEDCADGSDEASCVDPGTCPAGKAPGCTGACFTASWLGDGTCDAFLNCEETDWDGGDCEAPGTGPGDGDGPTCSGGDIVVCEGTYCLPESWLGDGTCDSPMDCAENGWDGGDCSSGSSGSGAGSGIDCASGTQPNCNGTYCYNSDWVGDGTCDSFFDCSATEWDGGDCL